MKFLRIFLILSLFSLSSRCNPLHSLLDYANGLWDGAVDGLSNKTHVEINTDSHIVSVYLNEDGQVLTMLLHYDDVANIEDFDVIAGRWVIVEGDKTSGLGLAMHDHFGFIVFKKMPDGSIGVALSDPLDEVIEASDVTMSDINHAFTHHLLTELKKEYYLT